MSDLLEDLLTWARMQTGKMSWNPEKLDLSSLMNAIMPLLQPYAEKKQITLDLSIPQNIRVYADVNMVSAVLRNLVSNAIKFTGVGGEVTLTSTKGERFHTITVTDTGVGISEPALSKLFSIDTSHSTPAQPMNGGTD